MSKHITFSLKSTERIEQYATNYRSYFVRLFEDSGIWSEQIIIDGYIKTSEEREDEIYSLINSRLQADAPVGHSGHNTLKIPWKTKTLFITYEDIGEDERIVTDLEILS